MTEEDYYKAKELYLKNAADDPCDFVKFNGNDYVFLLLTDKGKSIVKKYWDTYDQQPTIFGYYKFQFHAFMDIFGSHRNGHSELYYMDMFFRKESIKPVESKKHE